MQLPLRLTPHLPLRTERLLLTKLDAAHLPALAAMLADPVVMRHFPRVMTREESRQWLRRSIDRYAEHGTGLFAVLLDDGRGGRFIGDCGLLVRSMGGRQHLELGYHFARDAWGNGYATEAAGACVRLGMNHTSADEIIALIRPENEPSQAVARRIGMRPGGAALHAGLVHGVWSLAREAVPADTLQ